MWNNVFISQEAQNQGHLNASTIEAKSVKKIATTLAITLVLAISALVINPNANFNQSAQAGQTGVKQIDSLLAGGDNDWDGG